MNTAQKIDTGYRPSERASHNTERSRLVATVADLQKRYAAMRAKANRSFDSTDQRLAHRLQQDLEKAEARLRDWIERRKAADAMQDSTAANTARTKTLAAAKRFDTALSKVAIAYEELRTQSSLLSDALGVREPGLWPSQMAVATATNARVLAVLGSAGIKLSGYASAGGRQSEPLATRFAIRGIDND